MANAQKVAANYMNANADNPFADLDSVTADALTLFLIQLTAWMGSAHGVNLKQVAKYWRAGKVKAWLQKNLRTPTGTLYYGGKLQLGEDVPPVGSTYVFPFSVLHWSSREDTSRWFAGLATAPSPTMDWAGGFLLQATPTPSEIIVDIDALSKFLTRNKEAFTSFMPNHHVIQMFTGGYFEGEVLTTGKVVGKVVESRMF